MEPFLTSSTYHTHSKLICTLEKKEAYYTFILICIMVITYIIPKKQQSVYLEQQPVSA
jgi:hypothetical protein